jgi:2-keto-4-pentenoate hydratase
MPELIEEIADDLYRARITGTPIDFVRFRLPEGDKEVAYRISEINTHRREVEEHRHRVGRKVGLTNPIVQERAGVDEPDYGIVLDDMVFESPVVRPRSAYIHPKIEAELAFVLKHDILTADLEAIEAAIDYVTTAIELVDNRYFDYRMNIVDTIADNAACAGLVTGPVQVPYGEIDLREVEMILYRGDEELTRGLASNVMGNPINAMQWIAETSLRIGKPLLAGEIVLSGSIGLIVDWDADIPYTARYSHGLGEITAVLSTEENHA